MSEFPSICFGDGVLSSSAAVPAFLNPQHVLEVFQLNKFAFLGFHLEQPQREVSEIGQLESLGHIKPHSF